MAGENALAAGLEARLRHVAPPARLLVNAEEGADPAAVMGRSRAFLAEAPSGGLIVTVVRAAAPGLAGWEQEARCAALLAFTRRAALDWAATGHRVNLVGLRPDKAAAGWPPALLDDAARTVGFLLSSPSMTGQAIWLGA